MTQKQWKSHPYHQEHCYQQVSCKDRQCDCVCHQETLWMVKISQGRHEVVAIEEDGIWRRSLMEGLWWHSKDELSEYDWVMCCEVAKGERVYDERIEKVKITCEPMQKHLDSLDKYVDDLVAIGVDPQLVEITLLRRWLHETKAFVTSIANAEKENIDIFVKVTE